MPKENAAPLVVRMPRNTAGRDFVIGDVHGAYDLVIEQMRSVQFDGRVDRLFSVGDLIDRGEDSARVLDFLAQPYVFAIRGNHDDDFATLGLDDIRGLASFNYNGLGWAKGLPDGTLLQIRSLLAQLPLVIEIETERGTVGLVHGEVPLGMGWATFISAIERGDPAARQSALWGRERANGDRAGVPGIGRLFVGHTIHWNGPTRRANVYSIDTGAVFKELGDGSRGMLTMANLLCRTQDLAPEQNGSSLRAESAGSVPFGAYAIPQSS